MMEIIYQLIIGEGLNPASLTSHHNDGDYIPTNYRGGLDPASLTSHHNDGDYIPLIIGRA